MGKIFGKSADRKDIEEAIFKICTSKPLGVSLYKNGKFFATMREPRLAKRLLESKMRIRGRPTILEAWTTDLTAQLAQLDVALYWVKMVGLPLQYYESLGKICSKIGKLVEVQTTWLEALNGVPVVVCAQIADADQLPPHIKITREFGNGTGQDYIQTLEYSDILHKCDRCKRPEHTHRQCAGEYVMDIEEKCQCGQRW